MKIKLKKKKKNLSNFFDTLSSFMENKHKQNNYNLMRLTQNKHF
jgi:hypothetical protein